MSSKFTPSFNILLLCIVLATVIFLNAGITEMSRMGNTALEGKFTPEVMDGLCTSQTYITLGPAGCFISKTVIAVGERTVITPEEPYR
jgi:hypothetical protein